MISAAPSPPPDWSVMQEEVICPLCTYNLRGLVEPICPECGYRFDWETLLDQNLRLHPYLFEHHPHRNGWSFLQTLLGGLRPARFWQCLRPQQPSDRGRLYLYAVGVALTMIAATAALLPTRPDTSGVSMALRNFVYATGLARLDQTGAGLAISLLTWLDCLWDQQFYTLGLPLALLAWPAVTFTTLLLFAQSMRRAKARRVHVARCAIYCGDVAFWNALVALCIGAVVMVDAALAGRVEAVEAYLLIFLALVAWLTASYRLFRAFQLYLRFHRPLLTVAASQVIVFLVFLFVVTTLWR